MPMSLSPRDCDREGGLKKKQVHLHLHVTSTGMLTKQHRCSMQQCSQKGPPLLTKVVLCTIQRVKREGKRLVMGLENTSWPSPGGAPERAICIRSPKVCMVLDKRHAVFLCERRLSSCAVQLIVVVAR